LWFFASLFHHQTLQDGHADWIAISSGIVQTVLYCDFFYLYVTKGWFFGFWGFFLQRD
jgi:hypothetical protein